MQPWRPSTRQMCMGGSAWPGMHAPLRHTKLMLWYLLGQESSGQPSIAACAQVATHDRILLFDLFTLGLCPDGSTHQDNLELLDACLGPTLQSSSTLKVSSARAPGQTCVAAQLMVPDQVWHRCQPWPCRCFDHVPQKCVRRSACVKCVCLLCVSVCVCEVCV